MCLTIHLEIENFIDQFIIPKIIPASRFDEMSKIEKKFRARHYPGNLNFRFYLCQCFQMK